MSTFLKFHRFSIFALVILASCNKEDPKLPVPIIDFTYDPEIVEVGRPVTFHNLSLNANGYVWDFGDGQTSTEISPTITYDENDTYPVKLVAYTQDNQKDSLIMDVEVGQRVLVAININSIPFVNSDGKDWDDTTDVADSVKLPDFILVFGPQDDPSIGIATPLITDLSPAELPGGFELNAAAEPFVLTPKTWEMSFIDFDGVDIENAQNEDFEIMNVIEFNPVIIPTQAMDENGEGFVQVSLGPFSVDLYFEIQ